MAIVLKNAEFVFAADEEECLRQAVDILMDELFGVNVEVYDKLTVSALETYVMNRILSLPRWLAEKEAYYFLYDKISKGEECKMLTGVSLPQTSTSTSALVVESVDYLGFTKQEKETVFKRARSLMEVALKAIKKHAKNINAQSPVRNDQMMTPIVKVQQNISTEGKAVETDAADLYNNILKPLVKVGKDFVPEGKAVETDAADLYNNILKPLVKVGKDFVFEGKVLETDASDLYNNILKPLVKVGKDFVPEGKAVETDAADLYNNILKPLVKVGKDFVPEGKAVETDAADLYNNILKPLVKVGKDFVPEGKGVETDAADLYNNILKPMVKVGKDFVPEEKGVETDAADLYNNILKPMLDIGGKFVIDIEAIETCPGYNNYVIELVEGVFVSKAKYVGTDADDLYKNLLKPMIKTGNDFMSENLCGLKFIGCGEDMLKLLEMMRVFEASPMFMKSPGTMMVAASA